MVKFVNLEGHGVFSMKFTPNRWILDIKDIEGQGEADLDDGVGEEI